MSSFSPPPVSSSVVLSSVWQLLLHVLIPASLANEAARQQPPQPTAATAPPPPPPATLPLSSPPSVSPPLPPSPPPASALQCCDLVLIVTPGLLYRQFRRLASHSFDHLAIAVSPDSVLHVGPPNIRLLPASLLLQPRRQPLVLRPALSHDQRTALIQSLTPLVGRPYDTLRVLTLIARLATAQTADKRRQRRQRLWSAARPYSGHTVADHAPSAHSATSAAINPPSSTALSSLICTDAILNRLMAVSPRFRAILDRWRRLSDSSSLPPLDFHTMHSWSINDLHRIAHASQSLTAALGDDPAPFFTTIQIPPSKLTTYGPKLQSLRGSHAASLLMPLRRESYLPSSVSGSVLLFAVAWLLRRGLHHLRKFSPRSLALLSFTLLFSTFLPSTFHAMAVLVAVLSSIRQGFVAKSDKQLRVVDWLNLRSYTPCRVSSKHSRL